MDRQPAGSRRTSGRGEMLLTPPPAAPALKSHVLSVASRTRADADPVISISSNDRGHRDLHPPHLLTKCCDGH